METSQFDKIAASLDVPMMIVTTKAGDEADGCLVGFTTQCSIDPIRYLVCLSERNRTYELATEASALVVHVLRDTDDDRALARLFGEETAHETDKLARCSWDPGIDGVPVLRGSDWIAGRIIDQIDLGDHRGFVLDVVDASASRAGERTLPYTATRDLEPGNAPD
jgi:flavin reductase (DIM6/NTAB) family NADH-FMN oxidoreductase RutF